MKLSIVISTYNRADSLERTLASLGSLAHEIVVIDNESTDDTGKVAEKFGAHVYRRPNNLMLNVNKNFGIARATGDWILYLDDDEVVTEELSREIKTVIRNSNLVTRSSDVVGYWIARKNIIFGRWIEHGIWWPDQQLRLFRKTHGKYPEKHVHEYIEVDGPTQTLSQPYIHYNYDSISQYLWKMQSIYTESEVNKHVSLGYRLDWKDTVRFPVSDFVKLYFAQGGYKDGLHGLVLALLQAFYSFIVFVKLWERDAYKPIGINMSQIESEYKKSRKEIRYWVLTTHIDRAKHPLKKLWYKLLRRAIGV